MSEVLENYIRLRGKQLKQNDRQANPEDNKDKLEGRRKEIERLLEIINTDTATKELEILQQKFSPISTKGDTQC